LEFHSIEPGTVSLLGVTVVGLRLRHGPFQVLGFRVGNVAYCTDTNGIPEETWPMLADLDVLVLDALRDRAHPTHFSLTEALAVIEKLRPRRAYLTHICHELEHEHTSAGLPQNVQLAYDGLRLPLT
jgi:phosphoribosyl 1,2-cyclic phosphate phosphodiesterase